MVAPVVLLSGMMGVYCLFTQPVASAAAPCWLLLAFVGLATGFASLVASERG
jgi:hypothetical protein